MSRGKKVSQQPTNPAQPQTISSVSKPDSEKASLPKAKGKISKVKDAETNDLCQETVFTFVEEKMAEVFSTQYEELKEKLITLMAQQVSKLITKVDRIEQDFLKYKEAHQPSSTFTIVENSAELEAIKNCQAKKTEALSHENA